MTRFSTLVKISFHIVLRQFLRVILEALHRYRFGGLRPMSEGEIPSLYAQDVEIDGPVACFPSPRTATIHRMGLTKRGRGLLRPIHALGKGQSEDGVRQNFGKNLKGWNAPECFSCRERYSPLGVVVRAKSSVLAEFFWAKLSAARVYLPSASTATLTGGPRISSTLSGCWAIKAETQTTRRRGVEYVCRRDSRRLALACFRGWLYGGPTEPGMEKRRLDALTQSFLGVAQKARRDFLTANFK
jgi:hypothetical protein